jgi:xanthine dehydrogenase accessory factor
VAHPSGAAFAKATVVGRHAPVSSHLGDSAVIYADGTMEGFVGGACARDIVRRQALRALKSNAAVLVHIRPDASGLEISPDGSSVVVPMTCTSEGAVDVFIEPHLPHKRLVIAGFTPVADALARLALAGGYRVTRAVEGAEADELPPGTGDAITVGALSAWFASLSPEELRRTAGVVASQGHYDEDALEPMLAAGIPYVGLLASRKRASVLKSTLLSRNVAPGLFERLHNPAGLDLGARDPLGVAVSILAEIVASESAATVDVSHVEILEPERGTAIDPICGMAVDIATARHSLEHGGDRHYFCCAGCLHTFRADPHPAGSAAPAR